MKIFRVGLLIGCGCQLLQAKLVTVSFEGKLQNFTDFSNLFEGRVKDGDLITGMFSYDTAAKDTDPNPEFGYFAYKAPAHRMILNIGNTWVQTTPGKEFRVILENDFGSSDQFILNNEDVRSSNPLMNGMQVFFQSADFTMTAFSSADVALEYPGLDKFEGTILGMAAPVNCNAIITKVAFDDSLFVPVVSILPPSGDFLWTQSIDPVIRIDGVKPDEVSIEKILLDDVNVTKRYLYASRSGTVEGANPGAVWQLISPKPSPGVHEFKVKVRLPNGKKAVAQANWNILQPHLGKADGRVETNTGTKSPESSAK